jgi:hypothetical protein
MDLPSFDFILASGAVISAVAAILAWRESRRNFQISHTPILVPSVDRLGTDFRVTVVNNDKKAIAQHVSVKLFKGKLNREVSKTDEFLAPNWRVTLPTISENIDDCHFSIEYENFWNQKLQVKGTIHDLGSYFDIQNINFTLKSWSLRI